MDKKRPTYEHDNNFAANPVYLNKPIAIQKQVTLDDRVKFTVIGNRVTKEFIYCMYLVDGLYKYRKEQFKAPLIQGVTSIEWPKAWNDLVIQFGNLAHCLKSEVAVLIDNKFLGGEKELKELVESRYVYHLCLDYHKEGIKQFANYVKSHGRPCAYLHISINDDHIGTLIFMLYTDIVPLTCQNFLKMCEATKGGYGGTPIHRIVKNCWIQCGGFHLKSHNELNCENFTIPHDRRGVLCMANDGRHADCSTQFFVLLQPAPWMEGKYVAFGQLIDGEKTLRNIENVQTWYESPEADIRIYKAGIFDMNCHNIPVNKQASAYLDGHVEDLNTAGEFLYKILLQNVFMEIDKKRNKSRIAEVHHTIEDTTKNIRPTKRFMLKIEEKEQHIFEDHDVSSSIGSYDDETINSDAGDLYECEFEDDTYYQQITMETISSTVVKPEKPFYIPLTDVPYPGEVDSSFDLKKLLKGDYCLESDLEKNPVKRKQVHQIPEEELCELPECCRKSDDDWEYYINVEDEEIIKNYLRKNADKVSFAGPYVMKIAHDKLNILSMKTVKDSVGSSDATANQLRVRMLCKASSNPLNFRESILNARSSSRKNSASKKRPTLTVAEYQMKNQMHGVKNEGNKIKESLIDERRSS